MLLSLSLVSEASPPTPLKTFADGGAEALRGWLLLPPVVSAALWRWRCQRRWECAHMLAESEVKSGVAWCVRTWWGRPGQVREESGCGFPSTTALAVITVGALTWTGQLVVVRPPGICKQGSEA